MSNKPQILSDNILPVDYLCEVFSSLRAYCEKEDFKGWDPYDGLNSRFFKALPFVGNSAVCRLVWIQLFKRLPFNLRPVLGVPKQHNAKGVGLFLQGYCTLWHTLRENPEQTSCFGQPDSIEAQINRLGELLLDMRSKGVSGAAWGYNFPWQCRREFLFPADEPTIVATVFCAWALLDAAEITGRTDFRAAAVSSAEFIARDLRKTPYGPGVIISYSKLQGNDTIYNASLLGSRLLARVAALTGNKEYMSLARSSVAACCHAQNPDGSWTYGVKPVTGWIDSFHTGYNLDGLIAYQELSGDNTFSGNIERGLKYYLETFFLPDGSPKYYHNRQYPIDIHCPGQLIMTLDRLQKYAENKALVNKVLAWTFKNMRAPEGYFYYQLKRGISSKISYMRWSNAFMFCALSTAIRQELKLTKGQGIV